MKVVITGAGGLIGTVLREGLASRYELRCVDRMRDRQHGIERVDGRRPRELTRAFAGADAVIDLAANSKPQTTWPEIWKNNLPATMNALRAAAENGVGRFVFASSNHVTGMYERDLPYSAIVAGDYASVDRKTIPLIGSRTPLRPDSPYALGKVLGESAARYYADAFGLSTICLRIGTVLVEDRPQTPRDFATFLTHADLIRLCVRALEVSPASVFGIYYGVSNNTWRFWDIAEAEAELGFVPEDDAEELRDEALREAQS